jgi:hypothetical protein
MKCCEGGNATAPLTDADRRILRDFADRDPSTRHTRSTLLEWKERSPHLVARGLIEHGDPRAGRAHVVTMAGLILLERLRSVGGTDS